MDKLLINFRNKSPKFICISLAVAFIAINLHVLAIGLLPIDDHEIVMVSSDPFGTWLSSEAFHPWSRWRPSYYTIRSLEALIWRNSAFAWHSARLILIGFGIYLLSFSTIRITGKATGALLGTTLVFAPVLGDLVQILGPAETYCFLGLSMWTFGCTGLLKSFGLLNSRCDACYKGDFRVNRSLWVFSLFLLLGTIIAVGSKENMVILIFPNLWLLYNCIFSKKLIKVHGGLKITLALASLCIIPIIVFLVILQYYQGQDIYSNSLKPSSFEIIGYTIKSFNVSGLAVTVISLLTLTRSIVIKRRFSSNDIILAFLLFMSIWSIYFNRNITPFFSASRYAFLHQLGILGMFFIVTSYWTTDLARWGETLQRYFFVVIFLFIIIPGSIIVYRNIAISSLRADQSNQWKFFISSIANLQKKTNLPIVIVSSHWKKSFEPSYSTARFLRFAHGMNPKNIFLLYAPDYETRSRRRDNFQASLESKIISPENLDAALRSPSGGILTLKTLTASRYTSQGYESARICADPIGSTDSSILKLLKHNCKAILTNQFPSRSQ